jgi:catechol 2,3-dioxygenase-like lactoylglutathione lyase family enzyme
MGLVAIDHVQLAMPPGGDAEAAAAAFYGGVLGLERVQKPAPLAARGGVWFAAGAVHVHLGVEEDFRPAHKAHPAFRVDDLDALVARAHDDGYVARWDAARPSVRRCYIDDPFGNRIELIDARPRAMRDRSDGSAGG